MSMIYLAGPLGFTESGRYYHYEVLRPAVEKAGHTVLDPWEHGDALLQALGGPADLTQDEWAGFNRDAGQWNEEAIRQSDAVLAVVDGADVDSGTSAEIGLAAALCKPVIAIRSDLRKSADNPATSINLQVAHFVTSSGGRIVDDLAAGIEGLREILP